MAKVKALVGNANNDEYDDDLENLRDTIAEHLPTYAGDHEGENADAIDTIIAAGDELKRAKAWRAKMAPLIEAIHTADRNLSDANQPGIAHAKYRAAYERRADAVRALLAATAPDAARKDQR